MSAPASTMACINFKVISGLGSPAVIKGMSAFLPASASALKQVSMRFMPTPPLNINAVNGSYSMNIFITTPRKIHNNALVLIHGGGKLFHISKRMGGLQCRHNSFHQSQLAESSQGLFIGYSIILHTPYLLKPGVLRSDARIIQARRNRVRRNNLPVFILNKIGTVAMQYTRASSA